MSVRVDARGPVTLVTIDRPARRNALDRAALEELGDALDVARLDDAVRVVVLAGAGEHFCAGADLTGLEDERFAAALRGVLDRFREPSFVTMAAVHGAALGAGTQLAVACDLRVATPDARFGIPTAKLGLMVDHWTVQRLALLAGHGPARAMLLAADEVSGADALTLGLVQRAGGVEEALAWAGHIANLAPLTVAGHKLALERLAGPVGVDPDVKAAFLRAWSSTDVAEGMAAFRERRPPEFRGH